MVLVLEWEKYEDQNINEKVQENQKGIGNIIRSDEKSMDPNKRSSLFMASK